jgi:hypothetical protein
VRDRVDVLELLAAVRVEDSSDDAPDDRHDERGPAEVHHVAEGEDQREAEQHHGQIAGETGGAEHPGGLARLGRLLLHLCLGQLDLLTEERRQIVADVADQITDRRLGDLFGAIALGRVRRGHGRRSGFS